MRFTIDAADIPIIAEADVAVVGGSFAGVACALELSKAGRSVTLIEPRTYLGRELTATLRPWLETGNKTFPEIIERVLKAQVQPEDQGKRVEGYLPLHPDRLKLSLEDALADSGIQLLYASLSVGVETSNGNTDGLVIANKSGRQLIRCSQVVDMTETALVAALCGDDVSAYAQAGKALYYRTLEFVDVEAETIEDDTIRVLEDIGVVNDRVVLRRGHLNEGHMFVEIGFLLPSANTLLTCHGRELEARKRSMRLAVYLMQNVPAFAHAVLSTSSHELFGPLASMGAAANATETPDLRHYAVPVSGVWSLYRHVFQQGTADGLDAISGAYAGQRLARLILNEAQLSVAANSDKKEPASPVMNVPSPREPVLRIPVMGEDDGQWTLKRTAAAEVESLAHVDVLVVGGGSSGACASFTAAGEGVRTMLVELNPGLGGTGTFGGVDSYWFGRKVGYASDIQEAVLEVQRAIRYKGHKWNIEAKMHALLDLALQRGVELLFNTITFGAVMRGNRVAGAVVATRWGPFIATAEAVIDATGDGDLAAFAGADFVYGSKKDHTVMWYSLAQFQSPDKLKNNFTSMVDVTNVLDYTRAILAGRRRGTGCHDHGIYIATRESRHIAGDTVMRLSDQLLQRRWPDVVNIHFSNHDVKGVSGADWVNIGLIPPNLEIEIPFRMLLPQGLEGILVAGKAVSATHDALPAVRMQADLENLGAVAALAAAAAVREGTTPRGIDLAQLQARLVKVGLLPASVIDRKLAPILYSNEDLERLVNSIESEKPLYEYSNMRMNEIYRGPIPFVEICSIGPRIVPFLERALRHSAGLKQIRIAQALAMLGSQTGVPVLIEAIMRDMNGPELPVRTADIMYVQLPPDHGAMPDAAYLLYSLAQTKDHRSIRVWERVTKLLHPTEDGFKISLKGIFYFVDAICQGAERLGDPAALPALERLHRVPYLCAQQSEQGYQPDYFLERRAMLELAIGRAMARCSSSVGYEILISYLSDVRSLLSKQALQELERLAGRTFGKSRERWLQWLEAEKHALQPRPATFALDMETNSESLLRLIINDE